MFSGAGGIDIGLEAAGFETRLCVEIDEDARATLEKNRPAWKLATPGDVHLHAPRELLKLAALEPGELDLLVGGPPCQPFSKSGFWATGDSGRLSDPRSDTLRAFLDVVETALPRVVLIENVRGLTYSGKREGLDLVTNELARINSSRGTQYCMSVFHLDAADFGVPQHRERVFIVADRDGRSFSPPARTHGSDENLLPYSSAWDAIGNLAGTSRSSDLAVRGKWAGLLPSIPEGQNYQWHTEGSGGLPLFGWRTRYWSFLLKLSKSRPSWTIQATPGPSTGPFHWNNRQLSIREMCRLQTFPDSYEIVGNRRAAQRQIGNAVPCALAEVLGREIRWQLLDSMVDRALPTLIPSPAVRTPRASPTRKVEPRFLKLQGKHERHGGTGAGPLAARRRAEELAHGLRVQSASDRVENQPE